jgi:hypothetical protein
MSAEVSPLLNEGDFYQEGAVVVYTEQFHLRRGYCCGSGCRHCPFDSSRVNPASPRLAAQAEKLPSDL